MMEPAQDIAFVYVTFPNREVARDIGRHAVDQKLCACINIFPEHESIYRWNDKIEDSKEIAAILKTSQTKLKELTSFIETKHPFETPCIAVLQPDRINQSFATWLRSEMR